jgi:hypothetical protein
LNAETKKELNDAKNTIAELETNGEIIRKHLQNVPATNKNQLQRFPRSHQGQINGLLFLRAKEQCVQRS